MKKCKSIIIIIAVFFMPTFVAKAIDYYGHPNGVNYATNTDTTDCFNCNNKTKFYYQFTWVPPGTSVSRSASY